MKLTKLHLFLIVLVVLVASTLGFSIKEYYQNNKDRASDGNERENDALEKGSKYDPFDNADEKSITKKRRKKKKNNSDPFMRDYDCTIADLEDKVNPQREKRRKKFDEEEEEIEEDLEFVSKEIDDIRDNYILKSKIVPPVCPKCPDVRSCPKEKKCPPCPAPKRCPEVKFDCKANYNGSGISNKGSRLNSGQGSGYNSAYGNGNGNGNRSMGNRQQSNLPMPMLNSFAQFN